MGEPTFHWFLPTGGDGWEAGTVTSRSARSAAAESRPPSLQYLTQVALAAESSGFTGVLTPTGSGCEDAWVVCASLIPMTRRLRFLVAFRPGFVLPTLAAHQAHTFQRLSDDRLLLNIVTGGDPAEQRAFGDPLGHDDRYRRTDEFLEILRASWTSNTLDFSGSHYRIESGGLPQPRAPIPTVYFGGASPIAEHVAARRADVYLTWGEPLEQVRKRIDRVRERAEAIGRTLRFGIRFHVIARDRSEAAWAEADRLLAGMDPEIIAANQARFATMDSTGQARMVALHRGRADDLVVGPNLWAGIGLVRAGAATALVGSYEEVAERITQYHAAGFDEFILSGYPHLEEAFRIGERVLPLFGDPVAQRIGSQDHQPTQAPGGDTSTRERRSSTTGVSRSAVRS
jgi:alkanesulfonate monooxygenase